MIRWLTVVVGVGVTAAALYALLSTPAAPRARRAPARADAPAVSAPAHDARAGTPALDEIDEASRARLERVLRESESVEAEP